MSENEKKIQLPRKGFQIEFAVGLFTLLGVLAFGYLAINLAQVRLSGAGYYQVKAEFDNVSGLTLGAPVEIAGVSVGEVADISLSDVFAVVTLDVKDGIEIREDDVAAVRTKGIIGDKYVKIIPGGSEELLGSGDRLSDTEPVVDFEEIIGKIIHRME